MASSIDAKARRLIEEVVCPHCWHKFKPADVLWIAEAPALIGDFKLGETERVRFLPTTFDEYGAAIDAKGYSCKEMACPRCHLKIPAQLLEFPSILLSIAGAPACGKSYYLASSTYALRRVLSSNFAVNFTDADPGMNVRLQEYENLQFIEDSNKLVKIEKTETQGDLYDSVQIGGETFAFPQPFIFTAQPGMLKGADDPRIANARAICLYDNAGESYLPTKDADLSLNPFTRHLARSGCVFFLFDPTQDARLRRACRNVSNDPQLRDEGGAHFRTSALRQETVFAETIKRIRAYRRMTSTDRFKNKLVIIVSKADVWRKLVDGVNFDAEPITKIHDDPLGRSCLRIDKIRAASEITRKMLLEYAPDFVMNAENFAEEVVYIPVSATGASPIIDESSQASGFRVADMRPFWVAVPMLYAISQLTKGLVICLERPKGNGGGRENGSKGGSVSFSK